jgi:hypothetical protein
VASVASGSVITLTASVSAGSTALTTGQVNFCDAPATRCTDIHLLGTAQLTSAGAAVLKLLPGVGNRKFTAVFLGTNHYAASVSGTSALNVTGTTGTYASATTMTEIGSWGGYTLTATVTERVEHCRRRETWPSSILQMEIPFWRRCRSEQVLRA